MYSEKIEALIKAALADGELTEKEKQVLFKRAEAEGVDIDEFEMVLDARLVELRKENGAQTAAQEVVAAEESVSHLIEMLESAEEKVRSRVANRNALVESHNARVDGKKKSFWNSDSDDDKEDSTDEWEEDEMVARKKADIIKMFPVPNTKGAFLEFINLAKPNAKKYGFFKALSLSTEEGILNKAWRAKLEQLFSKARLTMKNDKELMEVIEQCAAELKIEIK